MHSAASIAQLAAMLLMSIIRSSLRTDRIGRDVNQIVSNLLAPSLVNGHELDWVALTTKCPSYQAGAVLVYGGECWVKY